MGMDVMRYEVIKAIPASEVKQYLGEDGDISYSSYSGEKIRSVDINERTLAWMKQNDIGSEFIFKSREYDWDAWFEKNPQYKDYQFLEYDLKEEANPKWIQMQAPDGQTVLINDGFIMMDVEYLYLQVREIGYMRKPFRHSDTPARVEGDMVVFTVTNFSDQGKNGFDELSKIDAKQTDEANVLIYDVEQLKNLKGYTCDPGHFQKNFMKDWKPNHYVLFNW